MLKDSQDDDQMAPWISSSHFPMHGNHTQVHAGIKQSITEIEAQIKELQVKLARQRALLSSNNVLPMEILARILGDHLNSTPDDVLTNPNRLAPLVVCRYWRRAALSSPSNWTTLDFTARWINPSHQDSDVSRFRTIHTRLLRQFDRAGDRPMDLIIRYAEPRFDAFGRGGLSRNERIAKVANTLSNSAHRFRSFAEFGISSLSPEDCFFSKIFAGIKTNILTRLRVRALGTQNHSFPNLEVLFVDGFVTLASLSSLDAPILQSLMVGGSIQPGHREPGKFVQILQRFPRLQDVTMICNANLLNSEVQHTGVKALRFHESIYPHSYTVPDSIRSLEGVCEFLQTFPNVDSLTFSSSIIYIYDDSHPTDLQGADRIRNLNFEGSIEFGWRSTIDAFSAFNGVTDMKVDQTKASSVFEWDKGRGAGNLFLFELLQEVTAKRLASLTQRRVTHWPKLEHIELVGVCIDQCSLNNLLSALRIRHEMTDQTGRKSSCALSAHRCSLGLSTLHKSIPDFENLSYPEVRKMFQQMQDEMAEAAENFLHEALVPQVR